MSALSIEGLRYGVRPHFWTPRKTILHDVSFSVERGELFGFLGPNGAGKTTTIKAVLGLLTPDAGRLEVLGGAPSRASTRARVGYLPERAYFPEHLTGWEVVTAHGLLAGLSLRDTRSRATALLERVGLSQAGSQPLRSYSKGMLQRVGLAQALVGDPELVVLDEPMSGLDPIGRAEVREIMLSLRREGRTVFFSTHILPDVEMICDRVAIVVGGRATKVGRVRELATDAVTEVSVAVAGGPEEVLAAARALAAREERRPDGVVFHAASLEAANRIVDVLRARGITVLEVQAHKSSLEDLFLREARRVEGAAP